jgi:hypothetical protein
VTVLRAIEQKIEALVEGVFGRAFRASVQPVEIARKLVKEMEDHRTVSVSRVYVPNEYAVYLSPSDRAQFGSYEDSLRLELQEYVAEHARREGYVMLSGASVLLRTDADLAVGEFGISTRMVQRKDIPPREERPRIEAPPPAPAPAPVAATMVYRPEVDDGDAEPESKPPAAADAATVTVNGTRRELSEQTLVLGRSRECDVQLADPNVSRRHAEVRREGAEYWIVDLGSTNGVEVNGARTARAKLEHGDRITLGSTEVVFERTRA